MKRVNSNLVRQNKKAQLKLSFGMMFSIILIIAFLIAGFYAIQKFLSLQDNLIMKKFQENFGNDLDKAWESTQISKRVEYPVSSDITRICIINPEEQSKNMEVYDKDDIPVSLNFDKIDLDKTLANRKSLCIDAKDSKISFLLVKKYGENLVTVKA